jgi:LPXTG-motif cell wall-anchored protein
MRAWSRILVVAGILLALLPSAAAAQSAGDEQYQDPFADEPTQEAPAAPPSSAPAVPAAPAPAPASAPAAASASQGATAELPRTGAETWLLALAGLALLAAGLALRAHARRAP